MPIKYEHIGFAVIMFLVLTGLFFWIVQLSNYFMPEDKHWAMPITCADRTSLYAIPYDSDFWCKSGDVTFFAKKN